MDTDNTDQAAARARQAPPVAAERLLGAIVRVPDQRESILGDLHEEYLSRADASAWRAALWYWRHAARIAIRILATATLARVSRSDRIEPPTSRGDSLMRTLGLEIRHAFRAVIKRPAMSGILVLTLSLGLGANAAIHAREDCAIRCRLAGNRRRPAAVSVYGGTGPGGGARVRARARNSGHTVAAR